MWYPTRVGLIIVLPLRSSTYEYIVGRATFIAMLHYTPLAAEHPCRGIINTSPILMAAVSNVVLPVLVIGITTELLGKSQLTVTTW